MLWSLFTDWNCNLFSVQKKEIGMCLNKCYCFAHHQIDWLNSCIFCRVALKIIAIPIGERMLKIVVLKSHFFRKWRVHCKQLIVFWHWITKKWNFERLIILKIHARTNKNSNIQTQEHIAWILFILTTNERVFHQTKSQVCWCLVCVWVCQTKHRLLFDRPNTTAHTPCC